MLDAMPPELADWSARALAARGLEAAAAEPLRVEASHRTFHRLRAGDATFVVMTSPPALENNAQFETLAGLFGQCGIPVPRIFACERERGFYLLEDLGTVHLEDVYGSAAETPALEAAIDVLHRIQAVRDPRIPPYEPTRFRDELAIFEEWLVGGLLCLEPESALVEAPFAALVAQAAEQPQVCVHRDYHCRNLLYDGGRIGVVDFQDALVGPALYDPASLLYDCYHEMEEGAVAHWLATFLDGSGIPSGPARRWLELTALQRQIKAVGIFARLHLRDGKASHLPHVGPVLARAARLAARHHETEALAPYLDEIAERAGEALGS